MPNRIEWEYQVIEIKVDSAAELDSLLNTYGLIGWELAQIFKGVSDVDGAMRFMVIFKREK